MISMVDRLARAKARPLHIESAVRIALGDAMAWRIGGGSAPTPAAFAAAAVAHARQVLDSSNFDTTERSRTLSAVQLTAKRFAASALCRRLMTVPAAQIVRLPPAAHGPDAVVRDRRRRLHAVTLKLDPDAFEAGRTATLIAGATAVAVADQLSPLTIHVFSLATGQRQAFERDVRQPLDGTRVA